MSTTAADRMGTSMAARQPAIQHARVCRIWSDL